MKILRQKVNWLAALAFGLTACNGGGPASPITGLRVDTDFPDGLTVTLAADEKGKQDQVLKLEPGQLSGEIHFAETASKEARLQFALLGRNNLASGESAREVEVTNKVKLKANVKEQKIETEIVEGSTALEGQEDAKIDCGNLMTAKTEGKTLILSFKGFSSLLGCRGDGLRLANTGAIGMRDITSWRSNQFSLADDAQMGGEFVRDFNYKNFQHILSPSDPVTRHYQEIMDRIAAKSDARNIRPTVFVVNADIMNAFALPGGYVYIFRGLIESAKSEAEVIGVLGHEWGHVAARHGTEGMSRAIATINRVYAYELAAAIIGGLIAKEGDKKHNDLLKILGGVIDGLVPQLLEVDGILYLFNRSRAAEAEADFLGTQYSWAVGSNPLGLANMFEDFMVKIPDLRSEADVFSDHPAMPKRVAAVKNTAALFLPQTAQFDDGIAAQSAMIYQMRGLPRMARQDSIKFGDEFVKSLNDFTNAKVREIVGKDMESVVQAQMAQK